MTDRVNRRSMVQLQLNTTGTYGAVPGPWDVSQCVQVVGEVARHEIVRDTVSRELVDDEMEASEELVATRVARLTFDVELTGAGAAGTAPPIDPILRAAGLARTITAGNRVEYTSTSVEGPDLAMRYISDGAVFVSRGARANIRPTASAFGIPRMRVELMGFDTSASTGGLPQPTFATWRVPQILSNANNASLVLGGSYSAGVISGGTAVDMRSLNLDRGNRLSHLKFIGNGERIAITGREMTGDVELALTEAEEVAWRDEINSNVMTTLGFSWGSGAGNRVGWFMPRTQRIDPQGGDYEGFRTTRSGLRILRDKATPAPAFTMVFR